MSTKKQKASTGTPSKERGASDIAGLREKLGLSRADFAEKLQVSKIAVLHWENGDREPSPGTYIRLAKLATQTTQNLARSFWGKAGVDTETLRLLIPEIEKSFRQHEKRTRDIGPTRAIPVLSDVNCLEQGSVDEQSEERITVSSEYVNASVKGVRLQEGWILGSAGFSPGDIVLADPDRLVTVDRSTRADDLNREIVIAAVKGSGKARITELWVALGPPRDGVYLGPLRIDIRGEYIHAQLLSGNYWMTVALCRESDPTRKFELAPGLQFIAPITQWIRASRPR